MLCFPARHGWWHQKLKWSLAQFKKLTRQVQQVVCLEELLRASTWSIKLLAKSRLKAPKLDEDELQITTSCKCHKCTTSCGKSHIDIHLQMLSPSKRWFSMFFHGKNHDLCGLLLGPVSDSNWKNFSKMSCGVIAAIKLGYGADCEYLFIYI